jgi:crotonobetainyl-CoA:carnitine CoA-transferase CaiB-like acyl-CoA transferase
LNRHLNDKVKESKNGPGSTRSVFGKLKVADFTWAAVGPITSMYLANFGAMVVRVESNTRPDAIRVMGPFKDNIAGINRSGFFANHNPNKYSLALNLNHPRAKEVLKRLISWADVALESFAPGVKDRWGLGYEDVRRIKPDIVMLSTSNQGQTGPRAQHPGYGTQLLALAGIAYTTGWPDREPNSPFGAYTDYIAFRYAVASLISALIYRKRTGEGQYIDLSQYEASIHFTAPRILDYTVNGKIAQREGNRCDHAAPHGTFRCRGEDRWCVIAVFNDQEWLSLCRFMGDPNLAGDPRFATLAARKKNEAELEKIIEAWTIGFTPEELMISLQKIGVPAGVVQNGQDLVERDSQLKERGHYVKLEHPEMGECLYDRIPFRLSKTPDQLNRCAPCLGQDTEKVCCEMLGLSDEKFLELLNDGVFT